MPALAPASYTPTQGLGGVRVLAGLGCGGGCGCEKPQQGGLGAFVDAVLSPLGIGIVLLVGVGAVTLFREMR